MEVFRHRNMPIFYPSSTASFITSVTVTIIGDVDFVYTGGFSVIADGHFVYTINRDQALGSLAIEEFGLACCHF